MEVKTIGRNDPCHCGSGKKYKKCCYQKDVVSKQAVEPSGEVTDFIKADADPYLWFKGLQVIVNRRDWALLYKVFVPGSPITKKYPTARAFVQAARISGNDAPTGGEYELRRFHLLDDLAFIMGVRGSATRGSELVEYEVLSLIKTEEGFRINNIETKRVPKTDELSDPAFADFKDFSKQFAAAKGKPLVRPEFERWTLDGPPVKDSDEETEVQGEEVEVAESDAPADEVEPGREVEPGSEDA